MPVPRRYACRRHVIGCASPAADEASRIRTIETTAAESLIVVIRVEVVVDVACAQLLVHAARAEPECRRVVLRDRGDSCRVTNDATFEAPRLPSVETKKPADG